MRLRREVRADKPCGPFGRPPAVRAAGGIAATPGVNARVRAVVTRVSEASVEIGGQIVGSIGLGYLVLLGVAGDDTSDDARYLAQKIATLRVFSDGAGAMNLALADVGGAVLAVSQFTLLGDVRKGRRPSFIAAAGPEAGLALYERFVADLRSAGVHVETGRFGAKMNVRSTNAGPVTILLDSNRAF